MTKLPPEDRPDEISIGPVHGVLIIDSDDPRFVEDRQLWSNARSRAQAMHSADELLAGMVDDDWRVRHEVVDRLVARAGDDPRTLEALLAALADRSWEVRGAVALKLASFPSSTAVADALLAAEGDAHPEVRWSVRYALVQQGLKDPPDN